VLAEIFKAEDIQDEKRDKEEEIRKIYEDAKHLYKLTNDLNAIKIDWDQKEFELEAMDQYLDYTIFNEEKVIQFDRALTSNLRTLKEMSTDENAKSIM